MDLNTFLWEVVSKKIPTQEVPEFLEVDKILDIAIKAIEFWEYYIEQWCSKCDKWKIKTKINYYPWYSTKDCKCTIDNVYLNKALKHLRNIDKRELFKYDYRLYTWKKPWKEYLYKILDSKKKWFYIYWPPWTWKTYSAYIMLMMYSIRKSVFASSLQSVLEDSRPPNEWLLYKKCENVEVLLLDDIWREKMSEWVQNKLFDLLNKRDKRDLITIFTSNAGFNNLDIFSDKAIKSRFEWNCNQIKLGGYDLR